MRFYLVFTTIDQANISCRWDDVLGSEGLHQKGKARQFYSLSFKLGAKSPFPSAGFSGHTAEPSVLSETQPCMTIIESNFLSVVWSVERVECWSQLNSWQALKLHALCLHLSFQASAQASPFDCSTPLNWFQSTTQRGAFVRLR
jgi:hypothetical protein